jgi:replicative DNA helicase
VKDLPRNTEAETAETWLLGGVFQDPKIMARFADALQPADFFVDKNRLVWEAMQKLQNEDCPIDIVTVGSKLEKHWQFQNLFGDNDYLFGLMESVPSAANAEWYIELISKASALRKLISAMQKTLGEAFNPAADADELIAKAMERIAEIASRSARAEDEHIADIAQEILDQIKIKKEQGVSMGEQTGFHELDDLTGGLRPGELVIIGARTGMGKTSFAIDIALHAAKKMPVKFFSLEMAKRQIAPRALSFFSQVNLKKTINASLNEDEFSLQCNAVKTLRELNLYMEFEANMSIGEICSEAHAFTARRGAGLIIIDHLHYLKTGGEKRYENRNIELGKITHALKELAKKLEIPIVLLSQLNREVDRASAKDKKPKLSDLRDSGNIEQDADMVWFIHRPGYYDTKIDLSETDLIIAKNRSGPTGEVKLHFDLNTTKFSTSKIKESPVNWGKW